MAIGRSGMTKELFGNRTKKIADSGVKNRGDIAKAGNAAHKAEVIAESQKGRTTKTPKTTADMYDRHIAIQKKAGNGLTATMLRFNKHERGLDNANPPGPQRTAKLTPKKMNMGGVVAPGDGAKETTSKALHTANTPAMKKGGKVQSSFMKMVAKKAATPKKMK